MTVEEQVELVNAFDELLKAYAMCANELVGNMTCKSKCLCLRCKVNTGVFLKMYKGKGAKWFELLKRIKPDNTSKCKKDVEQLDAFDKGATP